MAEGTPDDFRWVVDPRHGLEPAACLTLVRGMTAAEVLGGFGADPSTEPQPMEALRTRSQPFVAVAEVGGGVAVTEPNGLQGSRPEVLRRISKRGAAASVFWNVNAVSRFSYAEAGDLVVAFDPHFPSDRWGSDPNRFSDALAWGAGEPSSTVLPAAVGLAAQATAVVFGPENLELTEGYPVVPVPDDPRPPTPAIVAMHRLRRRADPDLVDAIVALPSDRQRIEAAAAAVIAAGNPDPLAGALEAVDKARLAFPDRGIGLLDAIRDLC